MSRTITHDGQDYRLLDVGETIREGDCWNDGGGDLCYASGLVGHAVICVYQDDGDPIMRLIAKGATTPDLFSDCRQFIENDLRNLSLDEPLDVTIAAALMAKWVQERSNG